MKTRTAAFVMVSVFLLTGSGIGFPLARSWESFAAPSAAFPLGTFTTELTREDIPAAFPPQAVALLVGRWETIFAEDGRHTVFKERELVVDGRFVATQNQVALYNDKGPYACDIQERDPRPFFPPGSLAQARPGVYTWTFDGTMLRLTKVADECAGRVVFFTTHPLRKR